MAGRKANWILYLVTAHTIIFQQIYAHLYANVCCIRAELRIGEYLVRGLCPNPNPNPSPKSNPKAQANIFSMSMASIALCKIYANAINTGNGCIFAFCAEQFSFRNAVIYVWVDFFFLLVFPLFSFLLLFQRNIVRWGLWRVATSTGDLRDLWNLSGQLGVGAMDTWSTKVSSSAWLSWLKVGVCLFAFMRLSAFSER